MNCLAHARVSEAFASRPPLDLVAAARCLARGHAAHALTLAQRQPSPAQADAHARKLRRANALVVFWDAIALHGALTDLIEEHETALTRCLRSDLSRARDRAARDIVEPVGDPQYAKPLHHLLPPREHLPDSLPEALAPLGLLNTALAA